MRKPSVIFLIIFSGWLSWEAGAQVGVAFKVIREVIPLDRVANRIYRVIADNIEPANIRAASESSGEAIKSQIRSRIEATSTRIAGGAGADTQSTPVEATVTVTPNVDRATIRIMNIQPRYHNKIRLSPGKYDIEVSKEGYRTRRFWATIPPDAVGTHIDVEVNLLPLGLPNCENNVRLATVGSPITPGGVVTQAQALFQNDDINDLYRSFGANMDGAQYVQVTNTIVHPEYVEMIMRQSTQLSQSQIDSNSSVKLDSDRFVQLKVIFETITDDVLVTIQTFSPPGAFLRQYNEITVCQNIFNF